MTLNIPQFPATTTQACQVLGLRPEQKRIKYTTLSHIDHRSTSLACWANHDQKTSTKTAKSLWAILTIEKALCFGIAGLNSIRSLNWCVIFPWKNCLCFWYQASGFMTSTSPILFQFAQEILASLGLGPIDLLKVDCEGCEWEILAKWDLLSHLFQHVSVELHNGKLRHGLASFWRCKSVSPVILYKQISFVD